MAELVLAPEDAVNPVRMQLSPANATYRVKRTEIVAVISKIPAILARDAALLHIINCGHANVILTAHHTAIAATTTMNYASQVYSLTY